MALATYSDLQASVLNWLHRDGDAVTAAVVPDLIALAEIRLSSDLNARDMDQRVNITLTGEYVTGPSDLVEVRRVQIIASPNQKLNYRTPDQLAQIYPYSQTGKPVDFTVIGEQWQFAPIPDSNYTLEVTYKQRIPALSNTNTTNWLLTKYPNAYLYATLCASAPFIVADGRLAMWEQLYQEAVQVVNKIDWYTGTTMTMQTDVMQRR